MDTRAQDHQRPPLEGIELACLNDVRDPKRIDRILEKLGVFWHKWPDLRLGQILVILTKKSDSFYVEDDIVEAALDPPLGPDDSSA